jgi:hypothetical protein
MSKRTSIDIRTEVDYDDRAYIEVRITKQMSSRDHNIIVRAANTIIDTVEPYLDKPKPKEPKS